MIWPWLLGAWAGHNVAPALFLRKRRPPGEDRPELALTFDDGPDPIYTPRVLEILAQHGVQASFFVVGRKAQRYPHLVRAIASAGHDVGNHSYTHSPPWLQLPWSAYRGHMRTNAAVAAATGRIPTFSRSPWGFPNAGAWWAARRSGQAYVHWTVHAYDWKPGVTPGEILRRVVTQAAPGGIVLLHDGTGYPGNPTALMEALPELIGQLQQRFRLVPLRTWLPMEQHQEVLTHDVDSCHLGSL